MGGGGRHQRISAAGGNDAQLPHVRSLTSAGASAAPWWPTAWYVAATPILHATPLQCKSRIADLGFPLAVLAVQPAAAAREYPTDAGAASLASSRVLSPASVPHYERRKTPRPGPWGRTTDSRQQPAGLSPGLHNPFSPADCHGWLAAARSVQRRVDANIKIWRIFSYVVHSGGFRASEIHCSSSFVSPPKVCCEEENKAAKSSWLLYLHPRSI